MNKQNGIPEDDDVQRFLDKHLDHAEKVYTNTHPNHNPPEALTYDSIPNLDDAIALALNEPNLLSAQSFICIWEMERIIKRVRSHPTESYESCFYHCLKKINEAWASKYGHNKETRRYLA